MKKQANLTCAMIVQQLEKDFWLNWDNFFIDQAKEGDLIPLLEEIEKRLVSHNCIISELYAIKHDKDKLVIWNEEEKSTVEKLKASHVHILIKFEKGTTLSQLAYILGIEVQYIEKAKSGRYGYDNLLAYLVHSKDKAKFQYSPNEVITLRGEDYLSVYNRRKEIWFKGRATKEAKEANLSLDYVISEILEGHITKSQVLLTNDYYKVYALNQRKIEDAFAAYQEKKGFLTIQSLENREFRKTIIFITGKTASGKTSLAKEIIKSIKDIAFRKREIWEHCITASTNSFDNYNGQEILFMDDVRGYGLTATDWLKLLDPYNISPISARYKNKLGYAKVIIIASSVEPSLFFHSAKNYHYEDPSQFIRRLDALVKIDTTYQLSIPHKIQMVNQSEMLRDYYFKNIAKGKHEKIIQKVLSMFLKNMKWKDEKNNN
ncbi:TPA: AAA family ATPase [Streptococcus equi subsp. zooepidemicus]|nr:AAA family ATPase [Streptococcus equi subsp. zooepidemicus]